MSEEWSVGKVVSVETLEEHRPKTQNLVRFRVPVKMLDSEIILSCDNHRYMSKDQYNGKFLSNKY